MREMRSHIEVAVPKLSLWETETRAMKESASTASAVPTTDDPTVLVIDDDPLTRSALSRLFRSVGLSARTFAYATDLLEHPLPAVPSCLVLDVRLRRLSGLDLQAELNRLGLKIPIIFITGHGDIPMSVKAMKAGAVDFLTKPFRDQEVLDAVTGALDRDLKRRKEEQSNLDIRTRFESLTARERQIMALVTAGLMNKEVAFRIGISEMTVKIHRGHMMRKMGTKSLADLVLIAEYLGIRGQEKWGHQNDPCVARYARP
jgi:FixJ family two-component response regulator